MAFNADLEHLIFDPPEFAPNRESLNLSDLGLEIGEDGADWGEAQVSLQMARRQVGSVVTDRHLEPVEMSIPLMAMEDSDVSLAEGLDRLQQKIALFQADEYEPGWLGRVFSKKGQFAGMVGYLVHSATVHGVQGRNMAHQNIATDIALKVLRSPLCYLDKEWEGAVHKMAAGRALVFEEAEIPGSGPGLMSLRVKNTGSVDLRAAVAALESRDHPQDESKDTTAALFYECEDLSLSGGTETKEREGASNGKVARASLTAGWLTILSSEIVGVGHMTHVGPRLPRLRVYDPAEAPGGAELRLQYRPLGALSWSDAGPVVPTQVVGWSLLDMGVARPERAVLGDQRWEWRVVARAPGGSATIDLDCVNIEPVEQHAVVRAAYKAPQADLQSEKSPGEGVNDDTSGSVAWNAPDNIVSSNNLYATTGAMVFGSHSQYLISKDYGFELPEDADVVEIIVSVERKAGTALAIRDAFEKGVRLVVGGVRVGESKFIWSPWSTNDEVATYSVATAGGDPLWGAGPLKGSDINSANFGASIAAQQYVFRQPESHTASVDTMPITVYYTEAEDENRICFQTRSVDFRSDGIHRQHPTDDVWGELINEGQQLIAPPSLLEGRAMRGIIIPSAGDLGALPDDGSHSLEAQVRVRPGFPFSSQALEAEE